MFTFLRKLRRAFHIYDDALAEAHADAKAKAGPMIERMTAEAVTEAKAKLAKALSDAEVAAEEAERKALHEGYKEGKAKGKRDGYAEGQEKAYYAVAAAHLPALFNEGFSIKDLEILVGDFDQAGRYTKTNWPNIYDTGHSYCVRVICEGRRHVQWLPDFNNNTYPSLTRVDLSTPFPEY